MVKHSAVGYNDRGQSTDARVFQPSGQLVRWDRHEYDEHGSETRSVQILVDLLTGNRTVNSSLSPFTYDSHGNWIKRITTNPSYAADLRETSVTDRVIQYYCLYY